MSKKDKFIWSETRFYKRYVTDGNNTYETVILPRALTAQVLKMAHDDLGHNGTHRTYTLLKLAYTTGKV